MKELFGGKKWKKVQFANHVMAKVILSRHKTEENFFLLIFMKFFLKSFISTEIKVSWLFPFFTVHIYLMINVTQFRSIRKIFGISSMVFETSFFSIFLYLQCVPHSVITTNNKMFQFVPNGETKIINCAKSSHMAITFILCIYFSPSHRILLSIIYL